MATKNYELRGDWMRDGYIDNLGRSRILSILVIDGVAYDDARDFPALPLSECRLTLDADDCLSAWGAGVTFAPAAGELDRIGRAVFKPVE